jgi:hypothetical protein
MLVGLFFVQLAILTYFIVSTELMLAHNNALSENDDFTQFGQVSLDASAVVIQLIACLPFLNNHK